MSFPEVRRFSNTFQTNLANKDLHKTWRPTRPKTWGQSTTLLRLAIFLKSLKRSLKITNHKKKRYDLSLVIVDQLTMIAIALH